MCISESQFSIKDGKDAAHSGDFGTTLVNNRRFARLIDVSAIQWYREELYYEFNAERNGKNSIAKITVSCNNCNVLLTINRHSDHEKIDVTSITKTSQKYIAVVTIFTELVVRLNDKLETLYFQYVSIANWTDFNYKYRSKMT